MIDIYLLCSIVLFVFGFIGLIIKEHLVHKIVSFNILTSGIFLMIITLSSSFENSDSVATALVLTGLVVSLGATTLGLMLIRAYCKESK